MFFQDTGFFQLDAYLVSGSCSVSGEPAILPGQYHRSQNQHLKHIQELHYCMLCEMTARNQ